MRLDSRFRRLAGLVASTFLAVVPALQADAPPLQDGTGIIKGRLIWAAGPIPKPKVRVKKDDPAVRDPICRAFDILDEDLIVDPATKGIGNAFAYLVKPSGDYSAAEKGQIEANPTIVIDRLNCQFLPHAIVAHKDQGLLFTSGDPIGHNLDFVPFANPSINHMLAPFAHKDYHADKAERRPFQVRCGIHPWENAWIFIVDHPFAVVTEPDGSFRIAGVPAGEQHLVVWQSRAGYVTGGGNKGMILTIKPGEVVDVGDVQLIKDPDAPAPRAGRD